MSPLASSCGDRRPYCARLAANAGRENVGREKVGWARRPIIPIRAILPTTTTPLLRIAIARMVLRTGTAPFTLYSGPVRPDACSVTYDERRSPRAGRSEEHTSELQS